MTVTRKLNWRIASFAVAGLIAGGFAISAEEASAKSGRDAKRDGQLQVEGRPMMAIVSLSDQRITIYDADGKILQAPVSTGSVGYETPAGIFSIVQKKEAHHSNLYADGEMPFMQRITWTGIALHAGALPGHAASHGCIRMPLAFAQHLFKISEVGMRVLVVRDDMGPSDIAHPALFKSTPIRKDLVLAAPDGEPSSAKNVLPPMTIGGSVAGSDVAPGSARHLEILKSIAAARAAEAEKALKGEREARLAAARRASEAAPSVRLLRAAEASHAKAEAFLKDAQRLLETATSPETLKRAEAAIARVGETEVQLQSAKVQAQAKLDAVERAREEANATEAASKTAADAADESVLKTLPVSVFISRKTQRLYVRKANQPVFEGPVTVRNPEQPIGTFVYTARGLLDTSGVRRWSVVSMYKNPTSVEPATQKQRRASVRNVDATPTDIAAAKAALDRIAIPQETIGRISEVVLPGSSLIISDEGASRETGKDTDFVVLMSGEPQGALKIRAREPMSSNRDEYPFGRSPFRREPMSRNRDEYPFGRSPFRGFPF